MDHEDPDRVPRAACENLLDSGYFHGPRWVGISDSERGNFKLFGLIY